MEVTKTCSEGHKNALTNRYCSICGIRFGSDSPIIYGELAQRPTLKKYSITRNVTNLYQIIDEQVLYECDGNHYLLNFQDYSHKSLNSHPLFIGQSGIITDTIDSFLLKSSTCVVSVAKQAFDNSKIADNFDSVASSYINSKKNLSFNTYSIVKSARRQDSYALNERNAVSITSDHAYEFKMRPQQVVYDDCCMIGISGTNIEHILNSTSANESYTHSHAIKDIVITDDDVIYLDSNGQVFIANKHNINRNHYKIPGLTGIHSIMVNSSRLVAVSYASMNIVDLDSAETTSTISGTFEEARCWLLGKLILTIEKNPGVNSYSVCVYDSETRSTIKRVSAEHEFNGLQIKEVILAKATLSGLLLYFIGSDNVKYLSMVKI